MRGVVSFVSIVEAMDVAEDDAVGERAEQRDDGDVDERADERAGQLERDADDERRDDAGEVGAEIEDAAASAPISFFGAMSEMTVQPEVGHALAEEGDAT